MKNIKLLLVPLILITLNSYSLSWEKIYDLGTGTGTGFAEAIPSNNGGFIGITSEETAANNSTSLVKITATGDTVWTKAFHEGSLLQAVGLIEDSITGEIVFLGSSLDTSNSRSIVLIRTDQNGNETWRQILGSPLDTLFPTSLKQTSNGGFLITGRQANKRSFILQTNNAGNQTWLKVYGDPTLNRSLLGFATKEVQGGGYIASGILLEQYGGVSNLFLGLDTNGDTLYTKEIQNSSNNIGSGCRNSLFEETNGNFVMFVHYTEDDNFGNLLVNELRLIRMDNNGTQISDQSQAITSRIVGMAIIEQNSNGEFLLAGGAYSNSIIKLSYSGAILFEHYEGVYSFNILSDTVYHLMSGHEVNSGGYIIAGHCTVMTSAGWITRPFAWSLDSLSQIVSAPTSNPCSNFAVYAQYYSTGITNGDSAVAYVTGGIAPYQYLWSTNIATQTITGLAAGPYCVTVFDANGCIDTSCANSPLNPDSVYPGDCNADGIADILDILPIGIGYGTTGPIRPNASLVWTAQFATDWGTQFINGANYKHADSDGNGVVDLLDANAILLNYGLTHNKGDISPAAALTDPVIYLSPISDTVKAGDSLSIPIMLGDITTPVNSIYGLVFDLSYDSSIVKQGANVTFNNSWLGILNNDLIQIQHDDYSAGIIQVGIVRNDQTNIGGQGRIAELNIVMQDDLSGKVDIAKYLDLNFSNLFAIQLDESVVPLNFNNETIVVTQSGPTGIVLDTASEILIQIYPNPSNGKITINSMNQPIDGVEVLTIEGRMIEKITTRDQRSIELDLDYPKGVYFLQVEFNGTSEMHKILIH